MVTSVAVGLILGGAISNLLDRFMFGGIIDFIDFIIWPVFNVADSGITIGVVALIGFYVWEDFFKKKKSRTPRNR